MVGMLAVAIAGCVLVWINPRCAWIGTEKQNGCVVPSRATQQIVGRERNQLASQRQLVCDVVVSRRVNSVVGFLSVVKESGR